MISLALVLKLPCNDSLLSLNYIPILYYLVVFFNKNRLFSKKYSFFNILQYILFSKKGPLRLGLRIFIEIF